MRGAVLACLLISAASTMASADTVLSADPVADARTKITGACTDLTYGPGFTRREDLDDDGREDLVLRFEVLCDGTYGKWCGTQGCYTEIWFAVGDGAFARAATGSIRSVSKTRHDGAVALHISSDGESCPRTGSAACRDTRVWDGKDLRIVWKDY